MKIRNGFVSNSSSSSFIITNKTDRIVDLVEFVLENPQLLEKYNEEFNSVEFEPEDLISSAIKNNIFWEHKESQECIFGDRQQTVVGQVFDYILRDGGESKSFSWKFHQSLR